MVNLIINEDSIFVQKESTEIRNLMNKIQNYGSECMNKAEGIIKEAKEELEKQKTINKNDNDLTDNFWDALGDSIEAQTGVSVAAAICSTLQTTFDDLDKIMIKELNDAEKVVVLYESGNDEVKKAVIEYVANEIADEVLPNNYKIESYNIIQSLKDEGFDVSKYSDEINNLVDQLNDYIFNNEVNIENHII